MGGEGDAMDIDKENAAENEINATAADDAGDDGKATSSSSSSTLGQQQQQQGEEVFSPELLKMYYSRLFPYELLHSWLAYDPLGKTRPNIFARREFSFTIEPMPGDEIYIRYQSFKDQSEFRDAVMKKQPRKIDIGAVFNHPPKDKKAVQNFIPEQRELVFDIDLTDYDEIRNCGCTEAKICNKCWTFMTVAVKVLDGGLKEDFGFDHIAWFYSGRRGIHAWVCDESARMLTDEGRAAVANYFDVTVVKKSGEGLKYPLHPMLERSYQILEPMFIRDVISENGHGLLASADQWEPFLDTMPKVANHIVDNLKDKWSGMEGARTSPHEKWIELNKHINAVFGRDGKVKRTKQIDSKEKEKVFAWVKDSVFKYTYPRLDINVSKQRHHLLKSPFCVHPKTGRVCIPIRVADIDEFDPFEVPNLAQLMNELDTYEAEENDKAKDSTTTKEWQKTSLKHHFGAFEKEFLVPLKNDLRRQSREEAEANAAIKGEF